MYSQPISQLGHQSLGKVQPENQQQHMQYNMYQQTNMAGQTVMHQGYPGQQNPQMINQYMYVQQAPYPSQQKIPHGQPQPQVYGQPNPYGQMHQPATIVPQPMMNPEYNQFDRYNPFSRRDRRGYIMSTIRVSKYGRFPVNIQCPHCLNVMTTRVKWRTTPVQYICCALLACAAPPYCCIPFCLRDCYYLHHICSGCLKSVE
ncbi:UNKNOWN [Stylonychia lemnae]|uniref:LITAF domain-containing protein n=1 Tax=Stylonychia lemnae TaxID=5949 RepID=A0A078B7I1_STYLE|nr:UNKNOWN [Stylonychia lemnae]|eukprot:CDW90455.1 UNKNOWN [Stylonychia lemnae]